MRVGPMETRAWSEKWRSVLAVAGRGDGQRRKQRPQSRRVNLRINLRYFEKAAEEQEPSGEIAQFRLSRYFRPGEITGISCVK